ncbi:MAG: hypothetical protein N3D81_00860 [Spirochaetes bacterium]|nr:hypothetical protein [Spirochaetota bacterium]
MLDYSIIFYEEVELFMNKLPVVLLLVVLLITLGMQSDAEIVITSSLKAYSHLFLTNTLFYSDILLDINGGNKYGGGIILTPISYGDISNVSVIVEKVEFFVDVFNIFKLYYWYGNKEYLGYLSSLQTRFYQLSEYFDFKGWYVITGTGLNLDLSLLSDAILISSYIYRSPFEPGIGSLGLKLVGRYRDVQLSIFSGISEGFLRGGVELKTFFRSLNAYIVAGIDSISLTNISLSSDRLYALVEQRLNFYSADNSWGFEEILTLLVKPMIYKGLQRTNDISDVDIRSIIGLSFFRSIMIGAEGIISIYNILQPVTLISISSELGAFIGFENNNILIKLQPIFLVLNTSTNQLPSFRVSLLGELRF